MIFSTAGKEQEENKDVKFWFVIGIIVLILDRFAYMLYCVVRGLVFCNTRENSSPHCKPLSVRSHRWCFLWCWW